MKDVIVSMSDVSPSGYNLYCALPRPTSLEGVFKTDMFYVHISNLLFCAGRRPGDQVVGAALNRFVRSKIRQLRYIASFRIEGIIEK